MDSKPVGEGDGAKAAVSQDVYYMRPGPGWLCFHCGERFDTPGSARDHFGDTPDKVAGCIISVGEERGLLMALRKSESANTSSIEKEQSRWQDSIYQLLRKECGDSIDGGGCDSGDPLDFTLSEIGQAIGILKEAALSPPVEPVEPSAKITISFPADTDDPIVLHIASDGVTYGPYDILQIGMNELRTEMDALMKCTHHAKDFERLKSDLQREFPEVAIDVEMKMFQDVRRFDWNTGKRSNLGEYVMYSEYKRLLDFTESLLQSQRLPRQEDGGGK